jgi:putative ABC transport system permease protein
VEVVGVVRDVRHNPNIGSDPLAPVLYMPFGQWQWGTMSTVVRTAGDPAAAAPIVRREIARIDPALAPGEVLPLARRVWSSMSPQRGTAIMLGGFALLALALAAIGLYGVISYMVTQRTREIGIRMALGARRTHVVRHVLRQSGTLVAIGLGIGLAGAVSFAGVLRGLLLDASPVDPFIIAGVAVVLAVVSLAASYLPARRASRVDPMVALRVD